MTACLHVRAFGFPTLIADTLVTWEGLDLGQICVPGTVLNFEKSTKIIKDEITRKVYVLNDRVAIAASGDVAQIRRFFEDVRDNIDIIVETINPLVPLTELVNAYPGVHMLIDDCNKGVTSNVDSIEISPFGECRAIGSGATTMLQLTRFWGKFEPDPTSAKDPNVFYALLQRLYVRHALIGLRNDITFGYKRSWGGFFEGVYFDLAKQKWFYWDPTLFGFLLALPLGEKRFTVLQTDYVICYDSGSELVNGSVLVLTNGLLKAGDVHIWDINDIVFTNKDTKNFSDWVGWQPECAVFSLFPFGAEQMGEGIYFMSPENLSDHLSVSITNDGNSFKLSQVLINEWSANAGQAWGLEYVPSNSISLERVNNAYASALKGGWN